MGVDKTYNVKIEIVSSSAQEDEYIVQIKNNADTTVGDIEIVVLFLDANNNIIDCEQNFIDDLGAGETTSTKIYVPYDLDSYSTIKYTKVDVKINRAVTLKY